MPWEDNLPIDERRALYVIEEGEPGEPFEVPTYAPGRVRTAPRRCAVCLEAMTAGQTVVTVVESANRYDTWNPGRQAFAHHACMTPLGI